MSFAMMTPLSPLHETRRSIRNPRQPTHPLAETRSAKDGSVFHRRTNAVYDSSSEDCRTARVAEVGFPRVRLHRRHISSISSSPRDYSIPLQSYCSHTRRLSTYARGWLVTVTLDGVKSMSPSSPACCSRRRVFVSPALADMMLYCCQVNVVFTATGAVMARLLVVVCFILFFCTLSAISSEGGVTRCSRYTTCQNHF